AVVADGGHVPLVDVDEVFVDPAVRLRAVGVEGLLVRAAADVAHAADAPSFDPRRPVAVPRRQPPFPDVRWLDHVVVDADDLGKVVRHVLLRSGTDLTGRQILAPARRRSVSRTWCRSAGAGE